MEITTAQIIEAIKAGYEATVIINGEYYTYNPTQEKRTRKRKFKTL